VRERSLGANLTTVRATLRAAERGLGFPLTHGFAALDAVEWRIKELRREIRTLSSDTEKAAR
jgi:hypothetical protein